MNLPTLIPIRPDLVQKHLHQAVELVLNNSIHDQSTLSKQEKIIVSKIYKNLNSICKLNVKQLKEVIKNEPAYQQALADIYFDKKINNYMLITNYQKQPEKIQTLIVQADLLKHPHYITSVDYRIEFTLSNITKKSVMKPMIMLVYHLRNNTKVSVYYNIEQFSLLRQRVASAMRQIYGIQLRAL